MRQLKSMDLDTIRAMDYYDFQVHYHLAQLFENEEREFRVILAGGNPKAKKKVSLEKFKGKQTVRKKFNPETGEFE